MARPPARRAVFHSEAEPGYAAGMADEICFEGTPSREGWRASQWLWRSRNSVGRGYPILVAVLALLSFPIVAVPQLLPVTRWIPGAIGLFLYGVWWIVPALRGPKGGFPAMRYTISAEGVRTDWKDGYGFRHWSAMNHVHVSRSLMVFVTQTTVVTLERRFLASDADWDALVALVRRSVPQAALTP